jgi:hypothetical protein
VVLRPLEGASLRETVQELCAAEGADRVEFHATGRVDAVHGPAFSRGVLEVLSLVGVVDASEVTMTLIGAGEGGKILGGSIVDARVVEVALSAALFAREPAPASAPSPSPSWADVRAASAAAVPEEEPLVDPPRPGDAIEHASFGLCTVEKLEEDEDFVLVRSPQNRLLRLSLDVLRPELISEQEGRRVFRARARGAKR